MTDKRTQERAAESNTIKRPDDWTTGDEPMTGAQRSYLKTLCEEAKVEMDDALTKAEASKRIDELQAITGRGEAASAETDAGAQHGRSPLNRGDEAETTLASGRRRARPDATEQDDEAPLVRDRPLKHSSDAGDLS